MDPFKKVSRWLKKATKLKETDLPEAIKLIRKAHDELEYEDPRHNFETHSPNSRFIVALTEISILY